MAAVFSKFFLNKENSQYIVIDNIPIVQDPNSIGKMLKNISDNFQELFASRKKIYVKGQVLS